MEEELDFKEILKYIYQRKNILVYVLIACLLIGAIYTFIIKRPIYKIESQILIDKADASIQEFVVSKDVLENENINVEFDKTTKIITAGIDSSKKEAENSLNEINKYTENLKTKLEETYAIKTYKIIETAEIPQNAYNISYVKDIAICLAAGVVIYGAYIMVIFTMRGLTNSIEIENVTKINVLGSINSEKKKDKKQKISYNTKNKTIIDQLKRIEANIELNKENPKPKTILVTGTDKNVGTTYVVNNLASQYAKIYNKILIIDTDINSKTLTSFYEKNSEIGLTNILDLKEIANIEKFIQTTDKENISLLPVGNSAVEEDIFLQEDVKNILEELKKNYDIILIDSPSINNHIIPIHLTSVADATTIVIESGKTKQEQIQKAKSTIEKVGGKITGIIINKAL